MGSPIRIDLGADKSILRSIEQQVPCQMNSFLQASVRLTKEPQVKERI